jgi:hypothetical protein
MFRDIHEILHTGNSGYYKYLIALVLVIAGVFITVDNRDRYCSLESLTIDPYLYDNKDFSLIPQSDFKLNADIHYACGAIYTLALHSDPYGNAVFASRYCQLQIFYSPEWSIFEGYHRRGMHCAVPGLSSTDYTGHTEEQASSANMSSVFSNHSKWSKLPYCDQFESANLDGSSATTLITLNCPSLQEAVFTALELVSECVSLVLIGYFFTSRCCGNQHQHDRGVHADGHIELRGGNGPVGGYQAVADREVEAV